MKFPFIPPTLYFRAITKKGLTHCYTATVSYTGKQATTSTVSYSDRANMLQLLDKPHSLKLRYS